MKLAAILLVLAFGSPGGTRMEVVSACQGIDLYVPAGSQRVAVYFHGGAWVYGDRRADPQLGWYGKPLLERGIAIASTDYRMGSWPAIEEDALCAVRYLRSRFREVVAFGGSAGGQVALMLAVKHRAVDAAVSLSGPVDLRSGMPWLEAQVFSDRWEASPLRWLDTGDPPTFVVMGELDDQVPIAGIEAFRHVILPRAGHGLSPDPVDDALRYLMTSM